MATFYAPVAEARNAARDVPFSAWVAFAVLPVLVTFFAMLTLGRAGFGQGQAASPRYITLMTPFWAGLVVLYHRHHSTWLPARWFHRGTQRWGLLALVAGLLWNLGTGIQYAREREQRLAEAASHVVASYPGPYDPAQLQALHWSPEQVTHQLTLLCRYRLSLFTDSCTTDP